MHLEDIESNTKQEEIPQKSQQASTLVVYHAGTSSETSEGFIAASELALVTNTSTGMGTTATSSTNANTSLTAGKDQSIPQQQLHDESNGQQSARPATMLSPPSYPRGLCVVARV